MKMKHVSFLALAIGIAFTSCSEDKKVVKEETKPEVQTVNTDGLKIAFYYSDSLRTGFTYYNNEDARLTKKGENYQKDMTSRQRNLEELSARYQQYVQEGTVTGEQLQKLENEIKRKQEQFMMLQQTKGAELEKETNESLTTISKKVEAAGKRYCAKYGIDILLIQGPGGQINFINKRMDVTSSFVQFLNNEHEQLEKDMGDK